MDAVNRYMMLKNAKYSFFMAVLEKILCMKHVIKQKSRHFAPLFGVVRALVRCIECHIRRFLVEMDLLNC